MADHIMADYVLSLEDIQNMKVTDLRKKLKALGLPIIGNKNDLVERLHEACVSNKGDSFDNSQLSYDESQINDLESTEDNGELEDSALLEQDQFSSYISSSLDDEPKTLHNVENSSISVIMPPKKRTLAKIDTDETVEKKVFLNRTNATEIEFDIKEKKSGFKPVTFNSEKSDSDDKVKLSFEIKENKSGFKPVTFDSDKSNSDDKVKLSLKTMPAAERLAMRAKRFNMGDSSVKTTVNLKAVNSLSSKNSKQSIVSSATAPDLNVLKKRAERFGQCVSTIMKQIEEKEKLLKRKCKFGANLTAPVTGLDEQVKKKQRAERFAALKS